ncbi:hypothetical protein [Arthrobacter sp. Marseille-P9274]|nr:hypothetical protein [Arthrobacter sp. Marseille-P9274]
MPHSLQTVDRDSQVLVALKILFGFDANLTRVHLRDQPPAVAAAADIPRY